MGIHDACALPGFRHAIALWFFFHVLTSYRRAPWPPMRLKGRAGSDYTLGLAGGAGGRGGLGRRPGVSGGRGRKEK